MAPKALTTRDDVSVDDEGDETNSLADFIEDDGVGEEDGEYNEVDGDDDDDDDDADADENESSEDSEDEEGTTLSRDIDAANILPEGSRRARRPATRYIQELLDKDDEVRHLYTGDLGDEMHEALVDENFEDDEEETSDEEFDEEDEPEESSDEEAASTVDKPTEAPAMQDPTSVSAPLAANKDVPATATTVNAGVAGVTETTAAAVATPPSTKRKNAASVKRPAKKAATTAAMEAAFQQAQTAK